MLIGPTVILILIGASAAATFQKMHHQPTNGGETNVNDQSSNPLWFFWRQANLTDYFAERTSVHPYVHIDHFEP